jgi:RNA polymerase sigma-70 factor (ECF subfamily)
MQTVKVSLSAKPILAGVSLRGCMKASEARLRELLIRALDGDQTAYRHFLAELGSLLRGFIQRQLARLNRPDSDIEDIVQEALLAIHGRRHTYDRDVPVTAWAYAIARYKLIDFLRSSEYRVQDLPLDEIEELVGEDGTRVQTLFDVRKALSKLPERLRTPTELTKIEGLTAAEAAAKTGMSEAAIKVNVHRALKAMGRIFG